MFGGLRNSHHGQSEKITEYKRKHRKAGLPILLKKLNSRKKKEQMVLVATDRDSKGQLVWEKSSIIVAKSEPQERAFEAARAVLAAKMEKAHASL